MPALLKPAATTRINSRCFSATTFLQKQFKTYQYKGAGEKPSMLIRNQHIDSSIWNDIQLVDDDIFINTPAKAGTTWTQEIVGQLLYNADYQSILGVDSIWDVSIWAAMAIFPKDEKIQILQSQLENPLVPRRIIKTHEPVESMPFNPNSKYIFVGRDYRDIIWSIYNMYSLLNDIHYELINKPREYPFEALYKPNFKDGSFTEYSLWEMMLNKETKFDGNPDGYPWWSQLWVIGSWWNIKHLTNVKFIHFNNLKEDLSGNIKDIAQFLEIEYGETRFDKMVENCGFQAMRNKKEPLGSMGVEHLSDAKQFFKGGDKRWKNILTEQDTENYRHLARRYMNDDAMHWLETGRFN